MLPYISLDPHVSPCPDRISQLRSRAPCLYLRSLCPRKRHNSTSHPLQDTWLCRRLNAGAARTSSAFERRQQLPSCRRVSLTRQPMSPIFHATIKGSPERMERRLSILESGGIKIPHDFQSSISSNEALFNAEARSTDWKNRSRYASRWSGVSELNR